MIFARTTIRRFFAAVLFAGFVGIAVISSAQSVPQQAGTSSQSAPDAATRAAMARLDALPPDIRRQMLNPEKRFVESPGLVWRNQKITVAFEGGSPALYQLIESTANELIDNSSRVHFSFRDNAGKWRLWSHDKPYPPAAIRISFDRAGYWSVIGITADDVHKDTPTMNFGGFVEDLAPFLNGERPDAWKASYYHTVILHEFGHSLGLSHEHFHPECQAALTNMQAVIDYLIKRSGWDDETAKLSVDAKYYQAKIEAADIRYKLSFSPHIDQSSIMLYNLPVDLIGAHSPCLVTDPAGYPMALSPGDRVTFKRNYG